jgi:hypothetical protein
VPRQIWDILEDQVGRLVVLHNAQDVVEEIAPFWTTEPLLPARLGERLARASGAKNVVLGDAIEFYTSDVRVWRHAKILLVNIPQYRVDLAGKYAFVPKAR